MAEAREYCEMYGMPTPKVVPYYRFATKWRYRLDREDGYFDGIPAGATYLLDTTHAEVEIGEEYYDVTVPVKEKATADKIVKALHAIPID